MSGIFGANKPRNPLNDEHYTPQYIFDALKLTFDLDPCSSIQGSVVPARQTYSLPFDGLTAPWFGLVWCNPPYSQSKQWSAKWLEHGNGLLLVPSAKSYWRRELWNHPDTYCVNLHPPKFMRPDGSSKQIMFPVDLWAIGDVSYRALIQSNLGRVR